MDTSTLTKTSVAATVLGGAGVAAYYYLNRQSIAARTRTVTVVTLSKEELIPVLKDLLKEFHGVFVEMANMVQRLKQLGALRGPDGPMSTDQIAEFLMHQGIQAKLDAAQNRVLSAHSVTEDQVELSQDKYLEDAEVQIFVNGFTQMYEESSSGTAPILPGLTIPADLTEDKALEILHDINQERAKGFRVALAKFWSSDEAKSITGMDPTQGPPPALAQALQAVHDEAETMIIERHIELIGDKATFDSAVALFSRGTDGAFTREKLRMDRTHQVEIVNLMRNKNTQDMPKLEPIDGLDARLQCSNEGDMAHQILDAAEKKRPVISALVRNMQDPKAALTPLSDALGMGQLDELVHRNAVFLYMPAHDDIPLASKPEYKNVDVCYIFFPRPDKQQRPIACFSLEELAEASTIDKSIYEGPGSVVFAGEENTNVD